MSKGEMPCARCGGKSLHYANCPDAGAEVYAMDATRISTASKGENMVERIARVQFETWNWSEDDDGNPMAFNDLSQDWRDAYFKVARAVIEAMMEPTPEMIEDVRQSIIKITKPYTHFTSDAKAAELLRSALRTVLSQPNEEGDGK